MLEALARDGVDERRLHGVDLIAERVATAHERIPGADVRRGDARVLPFQSGTFQLVTMLTCLSSMEAREDISAALAQAARITGSGGLIVCYEPRIPNPFNPATAAVRASWLAAALGPPIEIRKITGFPPIARHLGSATAALYPRLSRLLPVSRVSVHRAPGGAR